MEHLPNFQWWGAPFALAHLPDSDSPADDAGALKVLASPGSRLAGPDWAFDCGVSLRRVPTKASRVTLEPLRAEHVKKG